MTYFKILRLLLLLVITSAAFSFQKASSLSLQNSSSLSLQNVSDLSLNRTRRLSNGMFSEETLRLAKYMVSIRTRTIYAYYGENHFCGGVIIAPRHVLTSSHCLVSRSSRLIHRQYILLVVAGTPDRTRYQSGVSFHAEVEKIYVPDNFTLRNEQDIGILLLKMPFPRDNDHIAIARLPYRPVKMGTMCSVMGWGRMFKDGPISATILHIHIRLISSKRCAEMLEIKKKDLLCGLDEREDTAQHPCGGDRGAPLMQGSTVYGIVSYLVECDAYHLPSVYTDVHQSIGWVRRIIMDNANVCRVSLLLFYCVVLVNFLLVN